MFCLYLRAPLPVSYPHFTTLIPYPHIVILSSPFPVCLPSPLPPSCDPESCLIRPSSHPGPSLTLSLHHHQRLLPSLAGPMCALCSRSWALKRSTSARVGTGTRAPSAAKRRKSLTKHTMFYLFTYIQLHRPQN